MRGYGDFPRWEDELASDEDKAELDAYLQTLDPSRHGLWHLMENRPGGGESSLVFAKIIQMCAQHLPVEERLAELLAAHSRIDKLSHDIRGRRFYISMGDGGFSADAGGYTILADKPSPMITLRTYEHSKGIAMRADRREDGSRAAEQRLVPVTAINGMTIIAKHPR